MNGKHHKLDDLFKAMIMQDEEEASRLVISAFNGYIYFIVDLDVKLATQLYSLHIINDETIYEGFCTYVTYTMVMNTLLETYPWMDPVELESRKRHLVHILLIVIPHIKFSQILNMAGSFIKIFLK